jgi:peptidoglycan/xylan/chitin deacetylase (PgdA/CDA1 family)
MSYDDGKLEDRRLVAIFNKYHIKGTFHLNSGQLDQNIRIHEEEIPQLYAGHEVACHTLTHPTISREPLPIVAQEVLNDRLNLERITGGLVQGLSYPNGSYSPEIEALLPALGIRYSRIVGNSDGFELPENLYEWKATCHHNHNLLELGRKFVDFHKTQYLYMMYVWGHSYEFERDDNWELMEQFCELAGNREDIWYATNIEYVNYMDAAKRLVYAADASFVYNPGFESVWITIDNEKIIEIKGGKTVMLSQN